MRYKGISLLLIMAMLLLSACGQGSGQTQVGQNSQLESEMETGKDTESVVGTETELETDVTDTEKSETEDTESEVTEPESTELETDETEQESESESQPPITQVIPPEVCWVANTSEQLNIRSSASSDASVIGSIPAGEQMELLGWNAKFAKISYQGIVGYVAANYIKPGNNAIYQDSLGVVEFTATYTYEEMVKDAQTLANAYPDLVTLDSIGTSELGRDIPVLRIGREDATYHVLFQGAIHGREHMTSWLIMALADYWVDNNLMGYGDVCYHLIPMINPDGVVISQTGVLTEEQKQIYQSDKAAGHTTSGTSYYTSIWKANGLGVDLNRNFPAGWDTIVYHENPSFWRYKGEEPFSAAESRALRDYTLSYPFDATVSYHSTGSLIYHDYGTKQPVNTLCASLGTAVKNVTGYPMYGWGGPTDGGGYKDWVIEYLGIPSLTIETGCDSAPLAVREAYSILGRNIEVLPAIAQWMQAQ